MAVDWKTRQTSDIERFDRKAEVMRADGSANMRYRDWLNLKTHRLGCYDHEVRLPGAPDSVFHPDYFANNGAWLVRSGWAEAQTGDEVFRAEPGQGLILKPGRRMHNPVSGTP